MDWIKDYKNLKKKKHFYAKRSYAILYGIFRIEKKVVPSEFSLHHRYLFIFPLIFFRDRTEVQLSNSIEWFADVQ